MGNASSILVYPSGDNWVRRDTMIGPAQPSGQQGRAKPCWATSHIGEIYADTSDEPSQTGGGASKTMTHIGETTRCQRNRVVRSSIEVYGFSIW